MCIEVYMTGSPLADMLKPTFYMSVDKNFEPISKTLTPV
jgi:hypothetical protein